MSDDKREPFSEFFTALVLAGFTVPWHGVGQLNMTFDLIRTQKRADRVNSRWVNLWVEPNGSDWNLFLAQYKLIAAEENPIQSMKGVAWEDLLKRFDLDR